MIVLKSEEEIAKMRRAGKVVGMVLRSIKNMIAPGITTKELDEHAEAMIREHGANPIFKGYNGFPASACISINDEIIHGIPSSRRLTEGDIVGVDLGAKLDGFCGDSAVTFPVGRITDEAVKLLRVTEEALFEGIRMAVVGNRVRDISKAVQTHVESNGFSVVKDFVGHGIGRNVHEPPNVPNYVERGEERSERLRAGMVIAIEPMVNVGSADVRILRDNWTAVTVDRSLSAHFEHTVAITIDGPQILTLA